MRYQGALSDRRQKPLLGVLHALGGKVPIPSSLLWGFDALSGSVLLLAGDQYVLFCSFLVSLSPGPWGNVKKWQSSMKQLYKRRLRPHPSAACLFHPMSVFSNIELWKSLFNTRKLTSAKTVQVRRLLKTSAPFKCLVTYFSIFKVILCDQHKDGCKETKQ